MKYTITILTLLLSFKSHSQKYNFKKQIPSISTMYAAGFFDGSAETLKFHYSDFRTTFPKANPNYWNPEISWKNKYKDGNYMMGPRYFGSTTFLVWTTDGYHLMRFSRNTMFFCTVISLDLRKTKFKHLLIDAVINTSAYHLGFWSSYETMFNHAK